MSIRNRLLMTHHARILKKNVAVKIPVERKGKERKAKEMKGRKGKGKATIKRLGHSYASQCFKVTRWQHCCL